MPHWVTLQKRTVTQDAQGGQVETWLNVEGLYARIRPLNGDERLSAAQISSRMTHKVTLRYVAGLNAHDYRLDYDGRKFGIVAAVNVDERNAQHILDVAEIT